MILCERKNHDQSEENDFMRWKESNQDMG